MIKTLRIMLLPNNKQNTRLFQFAGTARFAYNWTLEAEKKNHEAGNKFMSDYELRRMFTELKQEEKYNWLYRISNNVTKQSIARQVFMLTQEYSFKQTQKPAMRKLFQAFVPLVSYDWLN